MAVENERLGGHPASRKWWPRVGLTVARSTEPSERILRMLTLDYKSRVVGLGDAALCVDGAEKAISDGTA